jgi:hypothetical protein
MAVLMADARPTQQEVEALIADRPRDRDLSHHQSYWVSNVIAMLRALAAPAHGAVPDSDAELRNRLRKFGGTWADLADAMQARWDAAPQPPAQSDADDARLTERNDVDWEVEPNGNP